MAERRMIGKSVICTDVFLEMEHSAQCLYFHFVINADDDGFVSNPNSIMRLINAKESDLQLLVKNNFVIQFENRIIVLRHWYRQNRVPKDRYKQTKHLEEFSLLKTIDDVYYLITERKQGVNSLETQYSLEEYSLGKFKELTHLKQNESVYSEISKKYPTVEEVAEKALQLGYRGNENELAERFVMHYQERNWCMDNGEKMKFWESVLKKWIDESNPEIKQE